MELITQGNPVRITIHLDAVDRDGASTPLAIQHPAVTLVSRWRRIPVDASVQADTPAGRCTLVAVTPADLAPGTYAVEVAGSTPSGTPLRVVRPRQFAIVAGTAHPTVPPADPEADITVAMQASVTIFGQQGPQGPAGPAGAAGPADWNAIENLPPNVRIHQCGDITPLMELYDMESFQMIEQPTTQMVADILHAGPGYDITFEQLCRMCADQARLSFAVEGQKMYSQSMMSNVYDDGSYDLSFSLYQPTMMTDFNFYFQNEELADTYVYIDNNYGLMMTSASIFADDRMAGRRNEQYGEVFGTYESIYMPGIDVNYRYANEATAESASAFGNGTRATNNNEMAVGRLNVSTTSTVDSERTLWSAGNGTSDTKRSNAAELKLNGDFYVGNRIIAYFGKSNQIDLTSYVRSLAARITALENKLNS